MKLNFYIIFRWLLPKCIQCYNRFLYFFLSSFYFHFYLESFELHLLHGVLINQVSWSVDIVYPLPINNCTHPMFILCIIPRCYNWWDIYTSYFKIKVVSCSTKYCKWNTRISLPLSDITSVYEKLFDQHWRLHPY